MRVPKLIVSDDEKHCVQACFRMVAEAFTGLDPGFVAADEVTGYVEGRGTWQFRTLLAFARLGLSVVDHESFDIKTFLVDPELAIRNQVQDEVVAAQNIADTDLVSEVKALEECLTSPLIHFVDSIPKLDDLHREVLKGHLAICNLNLRVLEGKTGHLGHSLVVEQLDSDSIVVDDPSPPGRLQASIKRDLFLRAWASPTDTMANFISVGWP